MTTLKQCNNKECISSFQDKEYGKNIRIHNTSEKHYKCTVCGNKIPHSPTKK